MKILLKLTNTKFNFRKQKLKITKQTLKMWKQN